MNVLEELRKDDLTYIRTPFSMKQSYSPVVINDIDIYNGLLERERKVLKHAVKNLNILTGETTLIVEKLAVLEYGTYNDAVRKRIKRAINGLIDKQIIAATITRNVYWLNRNVIWK